MFSPLELSSDQFVASLFAHVGRGREQAVQLYKSFVRQGCLSNNLASFSNAPQLYREMTCLMDCSHDSIKVIQEDGVNTKFVLQTIDGYGIECVVMTMQRRTTLCVSSQVGCGIRCRFCKTGQAGYIRNLSVKEIVGQLFVATHILHKKIQNIVFMGMGEPFSNFQNVLQAIRVLTDPQGFGIAARHITVATSGDVEKIPLFAENSQGANLAISLNAPTDELRAFLMPGRANCSLACLRKAMEDYCGSQKREILVSYVLLGGVNDSLEMAQKVAQFLQGLPVRINLIPFNAHPSSAFIPPTDQALQSFAKCLRSYNFRVLLRKERGAKIQAACGQLSATASG